MGTLPKCGISSRPVLFACIKTTSRDRQTRVVKIVEIFTMARLSKLT